MLTSYFATQYIERSKAFLAAKTVLDFVTGRAWVMSDVGSDVYSFTHRTFLEFFYARQLEQGSETVRSLFRILLPHIRRQEWDVVCHLALQIKTSRNQPRTAQAMQVLADSIKGLSGKSAGEIAIALFVARALEYLLGTEQSMTELVRSILGLTLAPAGEGHEIAMQCIHACYAVCAERRPCIHDVINDFLVDRFVNPQGGSDVWVAAIVSEADPLSYSRGDLPEPLCDLIENNAIRAAVRNRASTSMHYAKLRWEWYGEINEDEFRQYGFAMFFEDLRPLRQRDRGLRLLSSVSEAFSLPFMIRYREISTRREEIITRAQNLLRVICRAFSAPTVRWATTNKAIRGPILSSGMWIGLFRRARADRELFLGALAIFTLFTFSLSSQKPPKAARPISATRWAIAQPELFAQIERLITQHRCGNHPIEVWYRQQLGREVPELATTVA